MTNEEIVILLQHGEGDRQQLLETLWMQNIRLIRRIVHKATGLKYEDPDFEDYEHQAFFGVLDAIHIYDPDRGKFFTYAAAYIRRSVLRYYDRADQGLRIPEDVRGKIRAYYREKDRQRETGRCISDDAIREALGMSQKDFQVALKAARMLELQRLDSYLNPDDKEAGTVLDMISSQENTDADAIIGAYGRELHETLMKAIGMLPDREREVILARHYQGFNTGHIAKILMCTSQNVSQLARSAYRRMRTGRYAAELATFLPEDMRGKIRRRIEQDKYAGLSDDERRLLL